MFLDVSTDPFLAISRIFLNISLMLVSLNINLLTFFFQLLLHSTFTLPLDFLLYPAVFFWFRFRLPFFVPEVFNFISYPGGCLIFLLWYKFVCSCNNTPFQICPLIMEIFFSLILRKIFKNRFRKTYLISGFLRVSSRILVFVLNVLEPLNVFWYLQLLN